jgi:hypothetical protein
MFGSRSVRLEDVRFAGDSPISVKFVRIIKAQFIFDIRCVDISYCDYQSFSWEPGTSVGTVSGYGLDDQAIEVRSLAEAKGFFL